MFHCAPKGSNPAGIAVGRGRVVEAVGAHAVLGLEMDQDVGVRELGDNRVLEAVREAVGILEARICSEL